MIFQNWLKGCHMIPRKAPFLDQIMMIEANRKIKTNLGRSNFITNQRKSQVPTFDELYAKYTTQTGSECWYMVILYLMSNVCSINGQALKILNLFQRYFKFQTIICTSNRFAESVNLEGIHFFQDKSEIFISQDHQVSGPMSENDECTLASINYLQSCTPGQLFNQ